MKSEVRPCRKWTHGRCGEAPRPSLACLFSPPRRLISHYCNTFVRRFALQVEAECFVQLCERLRVRESFCRLNCGDRLVITPSLATPSTETVISTSTRYRTHPDHTYGTLSAHNGSAVVKMAQSAAKVVDISPRPAISHVATGKDTGSMPSADVDEDNSSISSDDTELDDLVAASSDSQRPQWKLGPDGNWLRYGSSESATSASIMSAGSSIAADDKTQDTVDVAVASKKRMSDGTLKQPALIRLGSKAEFPRPPPVQTARANASKEQPQPKRRGRPPKDKSAASNPPATKPKVRRASMISQLGGDVRPRSSIPSRLPVAEFASQCLDAAHASRLDPFALHQGEHLLLVDKLMAKEITVYLNIRNAILRLWHQNPLCSITPEEAAGCAKESRFFGLAEVAYKWLVRNGYINFGCVEVPQDAVGIARSKRNGKQKTVVVVGAGVSGLTAARQLEHLVAQDSAKWTDNGERPPKVIVLEGRSRVGGRVYSKPLRSQVKESLPGDLRNTAEMGAMIVTGFEHGNPLDTIIRGQLGLHYHLMKDALTIYDVDGKAVDEEEDMLNTELYTDISDRTGEFRARAQRIHTAKGDEELITRCRDPAPDGFENFQVEPLFDPIDKQRKPAARRGRRRNAPPGTEKITGRSRIVEDSNATQSAARAAKAMGWELKDGVAKNQSISLHKIANASAHPTLGATMDNAIRQYQELVDIGPQDMRLLNWHHANLEYANAAPVSSLSLSGHDQDTGNEFEGAHSEIVGGYTQVPRGLMNLPTKLDVRFDRIIDSIHYSQDAFSDSEYTTKVVCTDGEVIQADEVVLTAPLGVLKSDMIDFDPPLPPWKQSAINRMGFGLLNKVGLVCSCSKQQLTNSATGHPPLRQAFLGRRARHVRLAQSRGARSEPQSGGLRKEKRSILSDMERVEDQRTADAGGAHGRECGTLRRDNRHQYST